MPYIDVVIAAMYTQLRHDGYCMTCKRKRVDAQLIHNTIDILILYILTMTYNSDANDRM